MTKETIQEFTNRISQANKTEMIVIVFDIALCHIDEAIQSYKSPSNDSFNTSIKYAQKCINDLIEALNFDYEISNQLLQSYTYVSKQLLFAKLNNSTSYLDNAKSILSSMKDAFVKLAEQDESPAMSETTEHVVVGMTYGKTNLNENIVNSNSHSFSV